MSLVLYPARHGAPMSLLRAATITLVAMLPLLLASGPAAASPSASSRFWGYYQLTDEAWTFARTGADQSIPADGSVEGWRYAAADLSTPRYSRANVTFEQACGSVSPVAKTKRVGVVIDYGRPADAKDASAKPPAPRVACTQVPTEASGAQVLAAAADLRSEESRVCGVDSYPATGCFEEVATPAPAAAAPDEPVTLAAVQPNNAAGTTVTASSQAATTQEAAVEQDANTQPDAGPGMLTWVAILITLVVIAAAIWLSLRRRHTATTRR